MSEATKKALMIIVGLILIWFALDAWHRIRVNNWQTQLSVKYNTLVDEHHALCQAVNASGITVQCPASGAGKTPPPPPEYP